MNTTLHRLVAAALLLATCPLAVDAQTFDSVSTRPAGMGGAFVAVVDDASAVYWNPAGLAAGSFFSLVLDRVTSKAAPDGASQAGSRSGALLALGAPALGLSYYRLRATRVERPVSTAALDVGRNDGLSDARLDTLVSHHVGATLVQSVAPGLAVGATVKLVRGIAGSEFRVTTEEDLLDDGAALVGRAANKFDADIGVMLSGPLLRVGLTVRNLTEPSFEAAGLGGELKLERQARAGIALQPLEGWTLAADIDLLETTSTLGLESRDFALGTEGRIGRRAYVRAGTRFDTAGDGPGGRNATASFGGSYAVMGSVLIDGQVTIGSEWGGRGWGIGARFVY